VIAAFRREFDALPRVYWIVWLGTLVNKMGGVVIPFLTLYLTRQRGYSEPEAGLVLSMYGGGAVVASLGGGVLADRVGRRFTLLLSLFGGAAAILAIGFSDTLPTIAASTFAMGALAEMYRPAVAAMITDIVPVAQRAKAFAHLYWVVNLGFALAASLGGFATGLGYFALFVIDAITMAAYGLIVFFAVPESRPAVHASRQPTISLAPVLRDGMFMVVVLLAFGVAIVMWQNGSSAPIDMQHHGVSDREYGLLFAINGLLIVFLQPWLTARLRNRSRTAVLAGSALLFGLGMGLYGFVGSPLGYAVAIIVWSVGEIAHIPTVQTVVADLAPADKRGRFQGVYNMAWAGASLAGPLVGGAMLAGPGSRALWLSCFALLALVAVGHGLAGKARHTREAAPRASTGQIG
jgi:MFS family permease